MTPQKEIYPNLFVSCKQTYEQMKIQYILQRTRIRLQSDSLLTIFRAKRE